MIKICGIRDPNMARFALATGATHLGLVFATSVRQVSVPVAARIAEMTPTKTVGVFKDATVAEILSILRTVRLSAIQLHGTFPPISTLRTLAPKLQIYRAIHDVTDSDHRGEDLLLIDAPKGAGRGEVWDYASLCHVNRSFVVAGGLSPENVADAIEESGAVGVDVSSGVEHHRGLKDRTLVRAFIERASTALRKVRHNATN